LSVIVPNVFDYYVGVPGQTFLLTSMVS
jgi:hypothetical protein